MVDFWCHFRPRQGVTFDRRHEVDWQTGMSAPPWHVSTYGQEVTLCGGRGRFRFTAFLWEVKATFVSHFQCLSIVAMCLPGALPRAVFFCAFGAWDNGSAMNKNGAVRTAAAGGGQASLGGEKDRSVPNGASLGWNVKHRAAFVAQASRLPCLPCRRAVAKSTRQARRLRYESRSFAEVSALIWRLSGLSTFCVWVGPYCFALGYVSKSARPATWSLLPSLAQASSWSGAFNCWPRMRGTAMYPQPCPQGTMAVMSLQSFSHWATG